MDEEEVIDEVLEIERSIRMVMDLPQSSTEQEGTNLDIQEVVTTEEGGEEAEPSLRTPDQLEDLSQSPDPEGSQSTDAEGSPASADGQDVTFVVQLNDEGAIMLDKTGVVPSDAEPHVFFPITLPATKVKSVENPLAGVTMFPTTRSRKTKPQAILYNDEIDQIYEMLPDGSLNSITSATGEFSSTGAGEAPPSVGTESMDVNDLASRLLPRDFEFMENLLSTEVMDIQPGPTKATSLKSQAGDIHSDHNYSAPTTPNSELPPIPPMPKGFKTFITVISDSHKKKKTANKPNPKSPENIKSPTNEVFTDEKLPDHPPSQVPTEVPEYWEVGLTESDGHDNASKTSEGVVPTIAVNEANARARRSQRQQDRIERQQAEKILAENQQMLQREKELFGTKSPVSPSAGLIPPAEAQPILGLVDKPVSPLITPAKGMEKPLISTPKEDDPNGSRRPYPKRQNRKLPAHLADPNYINLEDSERKTHEEPMDYEVNKEGDSGDKESNDDDPNKLWCICRKPNDNKFMIGCDVCEDWFHGRCVGITKSKGTKLDKWICPNCKKTGKTLKNSPQSPISKISATTKSQKIEAKPNKANSRKSGRHSLSVEKTPAGKGKGASGRKSALKPIDDQKGPVSASADTPISSEKCIVCKAKASRKDSIFCSDECVVKQSHEIGSSSTSSPAPTPSTKFKRTVSSKGGVIEESENFLTFHVISAGTPKSTVVVPPKPKEVAASTPAKQSNVTSPSKQSSSISEGVSNSPTSKPGTSILDKSLSSTTKRESETHGPAEIKRTKLIEAISPKRSTRPSTASSTKATSSSIILDKKQTRHRLTSEGKDASSKAKVKDSEKLKKEPEKSKKETETESEAIRQTCRSSLTQAFESRFKELEEAECGEIPTENTPDSLSWAIEAEVFKTFSATSTKYRNKIRSIIFNLKDSKNNLFKTIAMNELKPKDLVKLEPHQLASDELAQWRINETKKELEMIKRSEIDKLEELKKQELIDAELGFEKISAVIAGDEVRSLGIGNVEGRNDGGEQGGGGRTGTRSSTRHKSHHHSHSKSNEKTYTSRARSDKADEKHKRDTTKDHRRTRSSDSRGERNSSTSKDGKKSRHDKLASFSGRHSSNSRSSPNVQEQHSSSSKDSPKSKDGERSLRSRDHHRLSSSHHKRSHTENEQRKESSRHEKGKEKETKCDTKSEIKLGIKSESETEKEKQLSIKNSSSVSTSKEDALQSTPVDGETHDAESKSDQEQPSSTIKTPDFSTDEMNALQLGESAEGQKPVLKSKFTMPELGSFNAALYNVSHHSLEGTFFPSSPVPIVGRIAPNTVWDYIDKMKKTKEVIILRLAPASPNDTEGYMTFFTYFSSRTRLGVLGGISSPIKDVYLVPLDKHMPVNKALLPLHGPGLPKKRSHCLLAVITRHSEVSPGLSKRKLSASTESPKRMKINTEIKPGLISSLNLNSTRERRGGGNPTVTHKKSPDTKISPVQEDSTENSELNDDDLPYTPWEEEEGNSPASNVQTQSLPIVPALAPTTDPQLLIQELDAQIQEEQQAIQNMQLAIIAKAHDPLVIPGLDGEFATTEEPKVPLFLRQTSATVPTESKFPLVTTIPSSVPVEIGAEESKAEPEVVTLEDDAAPYSPSQLDLDEDEQVIS